MSRTHTHQYRISPLSAPADRGAAFVILYIISLAGDSTLNQMSGTGRVERCFSREALRWPSPICSCQDPGQETQDCILCATPSPLMDKCPQDGSFSLLILCAFSYVVLRYNLAKTEKRRLRQYHSPFKFKCFGVLLCVRSRLGTYIL